MITDQDIEVYHKTNVSPTKIKQMRINFHLSNNQ